MGDSYTYKILLMSTEDNRVHPYPVRLTVELRAKLDKAAKEAGRSLNAEMLRRLEASFHEEKVNVLTEERVKELIQEELAKAKAKVD